MTNVLIGRQPIFDRHLNVIGYELLYRSDSDNQAKITEGSLATSVVLSRAFMEFGVDSLVGEKLAFVNLPREFILSEFDFPIAESQMVLEVLEDVTIDDEVVTALRRLRERGFQIALDDVVTLNDLEHALPLVHILKFEIMNCDRQEMARYVALAKKHPLKLLAEKVETQEEFQWCLDLGFDYFQGYFLCKPAIVSSQRLKSSAVVIVQILAEINSLDVKIEKLEELVRQDVTLSFKILRLINSVAFGMSTEIKSLKQALGILGFRKLRSLLGFMLLDQAENKPVELMVIAAVRGKMFEEVLDAVHNPDASQGFTVGFFSVLDALLDLPLETIMEQVPLASTIKAALVQRSGMLGQLLESIIAYEHGEWRPEGFCGLRIDQVVECYSRALKSSQEMLKLFGK